MNKLSSLFKNGVPFCYNNAKTLSFRNTTNDDNIIKTVNSVFFDASLETESCFTNSSESASHSTESDQDPLDLESVVRGVVKSDRLFFDPRVTSSIVNPKTQPIEEISVAVAMESEDPYGDFRRSMEEMVMSHGELASDWKSLESMLAWYLKMNGKRSHGVIVSAFVDLLTGMSDSGAGTSTDSARYSTAVSSPLNSQTEIEEEVEERRR